MQISNQNSNQNFGMAIHSNANVNKVLKSRIKNATELERLDKIIRQQAENDFVDIQLFVHPDGKSLTANVFDSKNVNANSFFKQYSENAFTKLFGGPVGFVEKLARVANKAADKIRRSDLNYEDVFKNLTK